MAAWLGWAGREKKRLVWFGSALGAELSRGVRGGRSGQRAAAVRRLRYSPSGTRTAALASLEASSFTVSSPLARAWYRRGWGALHGEDEDVLRWRGPGPSRSKRVPVMLQRCTALLAVTAELYFVGRGGISTHNSRVVQGSTVLSKSSLTPLFSHPFWCTFFQQ